MVIRVLWSIILDLQTSTVLLELELSSKVKTITHDERERENLK